MYFLKKLWNVEDFFAVDYNSPVVPLGILGQGEIILVEYNSIIDIAAGKYIEQGLRTTLFPRG